MATQSATETLVRARAGSDIDGIRSTLEAFVEDREFVAEAYGSLECHMREVEKREEVVADVTYLVGVEGWVQLRHSRQKAQPRLQRHRHPAAQLVDQPRGSNMFSTASMLLQNTWTERDECEFMSVASVHEVNHPFLQNRFADYKARLPHEFQNDEHLCFWSHGSGAEDTVSSEVLQHGLRLSDWSAATPYHDAFGPGLYFAPQAQHAMMTDEVRGLPEGTYQRTMVLFKM